MVEEIDRTHSESTEPDAGPLRVSVVFAMFREHERILPTGMHPHGEDFLVRKIEQLEWLLGDLTSLSWEMIAVDDGCPDRSGRVALEIMAERAPDAPVQVIFLEDGIREGSPVTAGLESTDNSRRAARFSTECGRPQQRTDRQTT